MNDDDVMAAVFAVLSKPTPLEPAEVEVVNVSQPLPEHTKKAASRPKAPPHAEKSRKSKLSNSWGPADISDEVDTSELSTSVVPAAAAKTSASPDVSRSRAADVKTPSQQSLPKTSTSTATVSVNGRKQIPPSLERPASSLSATILAGADISEVVVQGQGEGSSDESEDSDSEREMPTKTSSLRTSSMKIPRSRSLSRVVAPSMPNSVELSERDVEALLRGPMSSKSVLSLISSSSESGSEDEKNESEELASEEEEKEEQAYRRMSRRFARRDTSSDEEPTDDEPTAASPDVDKPDAAVHEPVSRTPTCIG